MSHLRQNVSKTLESLHSHTQTHIVPLSAEVQLDRRFIDIDAAHSFIGLVLYTVSGFDEIECCEFRTMIQSVRAFDDAKSSVYRCDRNVILLLVYFPLHSILIYGRVC